MANRYWIGGTGNWNDTTHWSDTSGGTGGFSVPTSADNAIFDGNSGTGTMTINVTASCLDFTMTGSTLTTIAGSSYLNIYGSITLPTGITWSHTSNIYFKATSTGKTLDFGNSQPKGYLYFDGVGGGWTFQSDFTAGTYGYIVLTRGSLDFNGKNINTYKVDANNTNTKSLTLGAAVVTCGGWMIDPTNTTFSQSGSTINLTTFNNPTFRGGGYTYNIVYAKIGWYCYGSNTFGTLTIDSSANTGFYDQKAYFEAGTTQTITGTFTAGNATAYKRMLFLSTVKGSTYTINAATVALNDCDFFDCIAAGAASPFSGTRLGNAGNNTNITFDSPVTRYWIGNGGNWYDTAHWSNASGGSGGYSFPLCHDTVVFDSNSITSASQTIYWYMGLGPAIDFSNVTNNFTFYLGTRLNLIGGLVLKSGMTVSGSNSFYYWGRSTSYLNSNGVTMYGLEIYSAGSNGITLTGDLTLTYRLLINSGTFDANDYNTTIPYISSYGSEVTTIYMGSGTMTVNGSSAVVNISNVNCTFYCETSKIIVSNATTSSKYFYGYNRTFYDVEVTGDNVQFTQLQTSTSMHQLKLNNPGAATGNIFEATKTLTVSDFVAVGSAGNLITIKSTSAGSKSYLSKSSGVINCNYLSVKDSGATGGASWYAGPNSTDVSGNSGWIFTAGALGITKSLRYAVAVTAAAITKTIRYLMYGELTVHQITKSIKYTVTTPGNPITKSLRYCIVSHYDTPGGDYVYAAIPYAWEDTTGATELTLSDDGSQFVDIGFTFPFYSVNYTQLYICSNGYLSLSGDDTSDYTPDTIPVATTPNGAIYGNWSDLAPHYGGTIKYITKGTAGSRIFIAEYNGVSIWDTGSEATFQIRLYEADGHIEVHTQRLYSPGNNYYFTQGVENLDGTIATVTPGRNNAGYSDPALTNDGVKFYLGGQDNPTHKSLQYVVKAPASLTKSLKYTVTATPTAPTKSLSYAVKSAVDKTKSLFYTVTSSVSKTKSLMYTILTTPGALTKALRYEVVTTQPRLIQKTLQYALLILNPAITKALEYRIGITRQITKSLKYVVLVSEAINKTITYTILTTSAAIQKTAKYAILTSTNVTKSLKYVILAPAAITKDLIYSIRISPAINKALQYTVHTVIAKTKQLKYVIIAPANITKQIAYQVLTVLSTNKSLQYAIKSHPAAVKTLKYVILAPVNIAKAVKYTLITSPNATKGLIYRILTIGTIAKSLQYVIKHGVDVTKNIKYTILTSTGLTKSLRYHINYPTPGKAKITLGQNKVGTALTGEPHGRLILSGTKNKTVLNVVDKKATTNVIMLEGKVK